MKIKIPFNEWSRERLKTTKRATSRTKKYGEIGDTFEEGGITYEIIRHLRLPLEAVADDWWRMEGAESPEEYVQVWKDIHPRAGWTPDKKVWLHIFRAKEENNG